MSDVSATLAERGARYGIFMNHATIAQNIQDVMRNTDSWAALDADMRQALTVIADKIARILNGKANYSDSWHDIAGYALLVDSRLKKLEADEEARKSSKVPPDRLTGVAQALARSIDRAETAADAKSIRYDKSEDSHTDVGKYRG